MCDGVGKLFELSEGYGWEDPNKQEATKPSSMASIKQLLFTAAHQHLV